MMSFVLRVVITACGLWLATQLVPGVQVRSTATARR